MAVLVLLNLRRLRYNTLTTKVRRSRFGGAASIPAELAFTEVCPSHEWFGE